MLIKTIAIAILVALDAGSVRAKVRRALRFSISRRNGTEAAVGVWRLLGGAAAHSYLFRNRSLTLILVSLSRLLSRQLTDRAPIANLAIVSRRSGSSGVPRLSRWGSSARTTRSGWCDEEGWPDWRRLAAGGSPRKKKAD